MKKTNFLTLIAAAVLFVLAACKPTEEPVSNLTDGVKVTTADPTFITGSTASCGAEVTADDAGLLIEIGVCWSLSEKPTVDDFVLKSHKCSQPYICLMTNLEPNTVYHVRGFAKYGTEYCYGDEKAFTTLDSSVPAASPVTTMEAYDITFNSFQSGAIVEPFGATNFYAGVCYSTNPGPTINDCEGSDIGYLEDGVYLTYSYDLMPNTQYYYRAFVAYCDGYDYNPNFFYGETLSFTTPDIPLLFEIETYSPYYSWGGHYIEITGYLYCSKPEVIDQVGFCYSTTNEYPQFESDLHTTVATPTGTWYDFGSYIYDLSAYNKYYLRSYVRYMTDSIKYGNVVSVDTY